MDDLFPPRPGDDDAAIWTPIDADIPALAGGWAEIVYDVSLFDRLERPALRWRGAAGEEEIVFGAAPAFGRGAWIGRVPGFVREASISLLRRGRARFRILAVRRLGPLAVLARAVAARPGLALLAVRAVLTGDPARGERRLRAALAARPLGAARAWRAARARPFEPQGLDAPSPGAGPQLRLLVADAGAEWIARLVGDPAGRSVRRLAPGENVANHLADLADEDLVAAPGPGCELTPEAAEILREAARAWPADVYYADEAGPAGEAPRLKPDWSPLFAERADLVGRAWCARAGWLRSRLARAGGADASIRPGPEDRVEHIRRVLLLGPAAPQAPPLVEPVAAGPVSASLIIPTHDRPDLLGACLASLGARADIEIVLIDNGGVDPRGARFLAEAARDRRVVLLRDDGPFNFSRLSNAGAAAARGPLLVFLNDDVEAREAGWLAAMSALAMRPDIGAVGARLLYPDGRLQHGGLALGVGGRAAHYERLLGTDDPDYFGRLGVTHEVSAVTGACLAVEARKFHAVGGFDAENLPVDLSDVDLCLRLAERGWRCVMAPEATLLHRESASRGESGGSRRYAAEIAWFRRRWARQIGDDPYFHPSLSLDVTHPALD